MKTKLFLILLLFSFQLSFGQWENLNTGINDDLTGVVFFDNNGLASGHNGLYYTTNYGIGSANWQRFTITDNPANSAIYENTKFTHCYANPNTSGTTGVVFACGQDMATNKAVIMKIDIPALTYDFIYIGDTDSSLNQIGYNAYYNRFYAVGDYGLYISFTDLEYIIIPTNLSDNLLSVDFYSSGGIIGSTDKYLILGNANTQNPYSYNTVGTTHRAVARESSYSYSVGSNYTRINGSTIVYNSNYNYGALNGQAIMKKDNVHLVGTDHGIFRSNTSKTYLEWQPSSSNYSINAFWDEFNSTPLIYACGTNGVILKSTDLGGATKPFATLDVYGTCVGGYATIRTNIGSSTSCAFYVDDVSIYSACATSFNHQFNDLGPHEVRFVTQNSYGEETTLTKTIYIVNPPEIDNPISLSDDILCKAESIDIQIQNSEPDVKYVLRRDDVGADPVYGNSPVGNGGTITMSTGLIDQTGDYYLTAEHTLANCSRVFSTKFNIVVEQTEAIFSQTLINATPNEAVGFYNHSIDAQNFDWTFTATDGVSLSSLENLEKTFSALGDTEVNFNVWSNNGCYDEITVPGPYIYQDQGYTENSWLIVNGGADVSYNKEITSMTPITDGFLTLGSYSNATFNSRLGLDFSIKDYAGAYLNKYDFNGVLKWAVYTKNTNLTQIDTFFSSVEDKDGNIYLCGSSGIGLFYDTVGNIIDYWHITNYSEGLLIKLDSHGKIIWEMRSREFIPTRLFIDKKNNLVATGGIDTNYENQLFLNGNLSDTIAENTNSTYNFEIVKFSPDGGVIWDTGMFIQYTNAAGIVDVDFDSSNNIFLAGVLEHKVDIYSVGNSTPETIPGIINNYGGKLFLVKFNEDGQLIWKLRSITYNRLNDTTIPYAMVTDENGNCYISGKNSVDGTDLDISSDYVHTFENTDGTLTQARVGEFFVAKVNSNGICEWIRGGAKSYYGAGHKIIKNGDEICTLVNISDRVEDTVQAIFTGTNGEGITLNINRQDYFMAIYDTDGNLKRIVQNGENGSNVFSSMQHFNGGLAGFFKGAGKNYYLSFNFYASDLGTGYSNFGNIIYPNNAWDGIITRFTEDDGIIYYPSSLSTDKFVKNSFKIYPNPTTNMLHFKSQSEITKFVIYNELGQLVLSGLNKKSVDLSTLSEGLYFIKLEDASGHLEIKKIVKK